MKFKYMEFLKFSLVSGIGWIIDFGVYFLAILLVRVEPFYANLVSAGLAVSFVFFISIYKIFLKEHRFLIGGFLLYLVYQACAIYLASFLISYSTEIWTEYSHFETRLIPYFSKIIITPITLLINYLFMRFLTRKFLNVPTKTEIKRENETL